MIEVELNQDFVRNLTIPPRPEIVSLLFEEMSRDEPDLHRIGDLIRTDAGLAAAMLKAANSPAFGLARKVKSVPQAIEFLGMRNVSNIATGLAIRHALGGGGSDTRNRHFWDMAEHTAQVSAAFARRLRGIPVDEAYTFGLFHDCGIPLLMRQFPRYETTLAHALDTDGPAAAEEADLGTHHGVVGYFLARSWQLPDDFCRAVLWHHDIEIFSDLTVSETVRNFVGIIHIAEHILNMVLFDTAKPEWERFRTPVLAHFGIGEEDFLNLADEAREIVG